MIQSAGNQKPLLPVFLLHSKSTCTQGLEAKAVTSRPRSAAYRSLMWYDVVWCGVVWCGVVWCGVVWCDGVWWGVMGCESKFQPTREKNPFFLHRFRPDFQNESLWRFARLPECLDRARKTGRSSVLVRCLEIAFTAWSDSFYSKKLFSPWISFPISAANTTHKGDFFESWKMMERNSSLLIGGENVEKLTEEDERRLPLNAITQQPTDSPTLYTSNDPLEISLNRSNLGPDLCYISCNLDQYNGCW